MLKFKRKSLGLSQKEAARRLHISPNTLSAIENRRYTDLHLDLVFKICKLYELDIVIFLDWIKSKKL